MLTMVVLAISLTAVIFLTSATARDAHRSNAGQKAAALAESGINNALAVLNANYPGTTIYPGDSTLLPATTTTSASGTGSVTWSGTLVNVPANPRLEVAVAAHGTRPGEEPDRACGGRRQESDRRRAGRHPRQHVRASGHDGHGLDLRPQRRHLRPVGQRRCAGLRRARPDPCEHCDDRRDDPGFAHPARASEQDRGRPRPVARKPAEPGRPRQRLGLTGERPGGDPRRPLLRVEEQRDPSPVRLGEHRQGLGRHARQRHPARPHHDSDADLLQPHRLGGAGKRHVAPSVAPSRATWAFGT